MALTDRLKEMAEEIFGRGPHRPATWDEAGVSRVLADGTAEAVRWDQLEAVWIQTTDDGPWGEDFFWVLMGPSGSGVVVPGARAQEIDLLGRLQRLEGFDNEAVIRASGCTDHEVFPCWRRPATAPKAA